MLTTTSQKEQATLVKGVGTVQEIGVHKTQWNLQIQKVLDILGYNLRPGQEIHIELTKHNLLIAKCGMYSDILSGGNIIARRCESVEVLDNGWLVVCVHGRYYLYYKDGTPYSGIFFLKKSNAIRFAKTL